MKSSEHQYFPRLQMNRILLGFRPIAPKPPGGEPTVSGGGATKSATRTKRKYVRVRDRRRCTIKRKTRGIGKSSPPQKSGNEEDSPPQKVTLQLLPAVRSESDDNSSANSHLDNNDNYYNNNNSNCYNRDDKSKEFNYDNGGESAGLLVTKTWIIVECVKDALMRDGGVGLGFSDFETINNLKTDTCPGFVSDGGNNVVWVNQAYRRMVGAERGVMVWLVVKEKFPDFSPSFACRVTVVQEKKQGQKWNRIVECDVWRMEFAGFAWRLDVRTALGLSI